jgi:hypothetical protein
MPIPSRLTDREAAIDAVLRFVEGLDDADASLVNSAFTPDATIDLSPISNIGLAFSELSGRDTIVDKLLNSVGPLDSSHHVSNFRVNIAGDSATLTCYALAQHFRTGQGPSPEHRSYFLMGNRYQADLVRGGDGDWRIRRLVVKCAWSEGDIGVLKNEV